MGGVEPALMSLIIDGLISQVHSMPLTLSCLSHYALLVLKNWEFTGQLNHSLYP